MCNVAISRHATASVAMGGSAAVPPAGDGATPLVRAVLRRTALRDAAATVVSDFPVGAGLGGSSAASVALVGACAELTSEALSRRELAARSREVEVEELGVAGGFQDHYAAAYGGALLLTLHDSIEVEELALAAEVSAALARRGVLVYTGESRLSADTVIAVRDAYVAGDPRVCQALARMKELAFGMAAALRTGDLDTLGGLLGEHWRHQRALHPAITTARIDALMQVSQRAGALGAKALGASGGGCVLALAAEGREEELARALAGAGERLDYEVDGEGFRVVAVMDEAVNAPATDG